MVLPAEIRDDKNRGHPTSGELNFLHKGGERHRPKHPLLPQVQLHQRRSHLLAFQRWEIKEQDFFCLCYKSVLWVCQSWCFLMLFLESTASGSDIVKLYDLTTLCEEAEEEKCQNPFTLPVAVLLYRWISGKDSGEKLNSRPEKILKKKIHKELLPYHGLLFYLK